MGKSNHRKFSAVVAIGASAGGLQALRHLLAAIPGSFPAPILVVQHLDPNTPSLLAKILNQVTDLQVKQTLDGEPIQPGTVYVAPPGYHLILSGRNILHLTSSAPVNYSRPSVDILFASLAKTYGNRGIAVILTGKGLDGKNGAQIVRDHGGTVIAQDQSTSKYFGMPEAAIAIGAVNYILPLAEIAPKLIQLVVNGDSNQ